MLIKSLENASHKHLNLLKICILLPMIAETDKDFLRSREKFKLN